MLRFTLRRLGIAALVALVVSALSFGLMFLAGDPATAIAGEGATQADIDVIRRAFGFDRPVPVQYLAWVGNALSGSFGDSYYFSRPVADLLAERFPATLRLGAMAIGLALLLSIPLGMLAAARQNRWPDRLALTIGTIGQATPSFWLGLMLIWLFAVKLRWLPVSGSQSWAHFVLPSLVLGYYAAPSMLRLCRAGMIEALNSDYVRTARAKGLSERRVMYRHALPPALTPVVTLVGLDLGSLLGGTIITERIWGINGVGSLAVQAVETGDLPVIMGTVLIAAFFVVTANLCVDILQALRDPRVRLS